MVDLATGKVLKTLDTGRGSMAEPNGLGGIKLLRDGNQVITAAYAGDLHGNVWKFDLASERAAEWKVSLGGRPLFTTADRRPVTAAPALVPHPRGGTMVLIGTGKLFETGDEKSRALESYYGLWDNGTLVQKQAQAGGTVQAAGWQWREGEPIALTTLVRRNQTLTQNGKLAIPQKTLEERHLMNTSIGLNAQPAFSRVRLAQRLFGRGTTFRSPAYYSLRKIVRDLRARQMPERPLHHLLKVLGGIDDLVFIKVARAPWLQIPYNRDSGGWYEAPHRDQFFKVIDLYQIAEQSPDPDNRITLSDERDATGMRKPKVEFRWRDFDIRSALGTQDIVQKAFEQSGIGRLRVERRDGLPLVTQMTAHPVGVQAREPDLGGPHP